ncbi:NUDIX domain-containing protein [Stackebrandtia soli]|uniref:NUDIX domain-containing protein n=1 Tax=Stackebrandtia soli TaxID=1892856 RepID=UPI0039EAA405
MTTPSSPDRTGLLLLLDAITPWDDQEAADLADARQWIDSGAALYRTRPPAEPPKHLVAYFVLVDGASGALLLGAHRKAGLWLPTGGHIEPGEAPWETVERECREELRMDAAPHQAIGRSPLFLTVTSTRGTGTHTDVSLWFVLAGDMTARLDYDTREFDDMRWLSPSTVLDTPIDTLDPHAHRFTRKLLAALNKAASGGDAHRQAPPPT